MDKDTVSQMNTAGLAAAAAAERITSMYSEEDATPNELAAGYAVAISTIEAVAPFGACPAQQLLDDCIDVVLDGWDYSDEMDAAGFLEALAEGLGM